MRVYHDRLVSDEDKTLFISELMEIANTVFKDELAKQEKEEDKVFRSKPIIFGDFMGGRDV